MVHTLIKKTHTLVLGVNTLFTKIKPEFNLMPILKPPLGEHLGVTLKPRRRDVARQPLENPQKFLPHMKAARVEPVEVRRHAACLNE